MMWCLPAGRLLEVDQDVSLSQVTRILAAHKRLERKRASVGGQTRVEFGNFGVFPVFYRVLGAQKTA